MKTKGVVFLLVAMLVGMDAKAQYDDQYYHRIGDTVE